MLTRIWLLSTAMLVLPALTLAQENKGKGKAFSDIDFVKMAASGGMLEVEAGKLAQERATMPAVKQFGERMVTDHSKANKELMAVAEKMNLRIDKSMTKEHQQHFDMLKKAPQAGFDKMYMDHMVKDHDKDVMEFREASESAKNADLRQFATKTLPIIEMHDKMAKDIQSKMSGGPGRGTGTGDGPTR